MRQDALSEVMKVYPLVKLKAFVYDITAFLEGRNKELRSNAEKVFEGDENGSGGEGSEAVDHGRRRTGRDEHGHCAMQLLG